MKASKIKAKVKDFVEDLSWNKHAVLPMKLGEIVVIHEDQSEIGEDYIRVIRKGGRVEVLNMNYFEVL